MKPLPQRKKTAEEIEKLREGFLPNAPAPAAVERAASLPIPPAPSEAAPPPPAEPRPPVEAKPVRSLRKSERVPVTPKTIAPDASSPLPVHRRSDQELNQIRRAQALAIQSPAAHLIALTAHPLLLGLGYFFVLAALALPVIDWLWVSISYPAPLAVAVLGILFAVFIFLKKKRSVHHACFIATIAAFEIIFGALYYFPHLRNAS